MTRSMMNTPIQTLVDDSATHAAWLRANAPDGILLQLHSARAAHSVINVARILR